MNPILIGSLLVLTFSNGAAQRLFGTYRSNFASAGFFTTEITFTNDSTFEYIFSGDLIHKELSGAYLIRHGDVYLLFDEGAGPTIKLDSAEAKELELGFGKLVYEYANANYHGYSVQREDGIDYHVKYKFEKGRLYVYRIDNGQLVTTDKFYDGQKWVLKECYLEKVDH